jgi:mono/diheme cytochrome c family protein
MNNVLHMKTALAAGTSAAILFSAALFACYAPKARATEAFAKQTGQECGQCHTAAKGGGPLTPYGTKFKANGNKVPKVVGN